MNLCIGKCRVINLTKYLYVCIIVLLSLVTSLSFLLHWFRSLLNAMENKLSTGFLLFVFGSFSHIDSMSNPLFGICYCSLIDVVLHRTVIICKKKLLWRFFKTLVQCDKYSFNQFGFFGFFLFCLFRFCFFCFFYDKCYANGSFHSWILVIYSSLHLGSLLYILEYR